MGAGAEKAEAPPPPSGFWELGLCRRGNFSSLELALSQACSLLSCPSKRQTGKRCWEVECLRVQASPGRARPCLGLGAGDRRASCTFLLVLILVVARAPLHRDPRCFFFF